MEGETKEKTLILTSKDGKKFEISRKNALLSKVIENLLVDYSDDEAIPMMEVDEETLKLVLNYLNHCNGVAQEEIEKPIKSQKMSEVTEEWFAKFVDDLTLDELVNVTSAANYMEIPSLLDLTCAKLASMCKDKTEEEIFSTFGVTDTFTEEERKKIREEHKWIEDTL
jgi:S-phase kinase-associated protein 1